MKLSWALDGKRDRENRKTYFEHDLRKVEVKGGMGKGEQNKDYISLKELERIQGGEIWMWCHMK